MEEDCASVSSASTSDINVVLELQATSSSDEVFLPLEAQNYAYQNHGQVCHGSTEVSINEVPQMMAHPVCSGDHIFSGRIANIIGHHTSHPQPQPRTQNQVQSSNSNSKPQMAPTSEPIRGRVFIGGLDSTSTQDNNILYKTFRPLGEITSHRIVRDRAGISKGYGFVTFKHQKDADSAIQNYHNKIYIGNYEKPLQISQAVTVVQRSPRNSASNNSSATRKKLESIQEDLLESGELTPTCF